MANRLDYFFRQKVTEAELDEGFNKLELADRKLMSDQGLVGIFSGAIVTEKAGTPDLSVDVSGPAVVYNQQGERTSFSPLQNLDVSLDENAVSTTVAAGGNEKTLSVFVEFDRLLSDSRLDGNNNPVFFKRDESFKLNVAQSAEAALGTSVPPALRADQILLADILLINGQTSVLNADINSFATNRREDAFVLAGSPKSVREGTVVEVLQKFQDQLNVIAGQDETAVSPLDWVTDAVNWVLALGSQVEWSNTAPSGVQDIRIPLSIPVGEILNSIKVNIKTNANSDTIQFFLIRVPVSGTGVTVDSDFTFTGTGELELPGIDHTVLADNTYHMLFQFTGSSGNVVLSYASYKETQAP